MSNEKEQYQLICDKLLEKYELKCSVIEIHEPDCIIYVENFDINCRINSTYPIAVWVEYVATCCYRSIPRHYIDLINKRQAVIL